MNIIEALRTRLIVKFLAAAASTLVLVMAILSAIQLGTQEQGIAREIEERGRAMSKLLTVSAVQPILNYDFATLESLLHTAVEDNAIASLRVLDGEGKEVGKASSQASGRLHAFRSPIAGNEGVTLGTLLLEVDHADATECRKAIAPFAELERAPEHIHTYRLTPLGLWNARAAGHDAEQVIDQMKRLR